MKDTHVTKHFADFTDGNADAATRARIEAHIASCTSCRAYYDKMSALLDTMTPSALPELATDFHLPARVRALAKEQARGGATAGHPHRLAAWWRVSFAGFAAAAAVAFGIYIGNGAGSALTSTQSFEVVQSGDDDTSEVFDLYYESLSQSGFTDDWSEWEGNDQQ